MKLNADITQPARVHAAGLPWVPSPLPGVDRRMLERDGDEVARVTSIVRYAPGSRFSRHQHAGGEEFLVLEGVFGDEHGDFPTGTYVRNPVGSAHTPRCEAGCVILVKLRWMLPADQQSVRMDTTQGAWQTAADGTRSLLLHRFGSEENLLLDLPRGSILAARPVAGGEEVFVVSGRLDDAVGQLAAHSWLRTPAGSAPAAALTALQDSRIYIKRGHLGQPPPQY